MPLELIWIAALLCYYWFSVVLFLYSSNSWWTIEAIFVETEVVVWSIGTRDEQKPQFIYSNEVYLCSNETRYIELYVVIGCNSLYYYIRSCKRCGRGKFRTLLAVQTPYYVITLKRSGPSAKASVYDIQLVMIWELDHDSLPDVYPVVYECVAGRQQY